MNYKVINGGNTYRLITSGEATALFDAGNSNTKVYAFVDEDAAQKYNESIGEDGLGITPGMHRLQTSDDVNLYVREHFVTQFAIKVGKLGDMLLHMDD